MKQNNLLSLVETRCLLRREDKIRNARRTVKAFVDDTTDCKMQKENDEEEGSERRRNCNGLRDAEPITVIISGPEPKTE